MGIIYGILRQAGYNAFNVHIYEVVDSLFLFHIVFMTVYSNNGISFLRSIILYSVEYS